MQNQSASRPAWSAWAAAGLSLFGHIVLLCATGSAIGNAAGGVNGAAVVKRDSSGAVSVILGPATPIRGNTTDSVATTAGAAPPPIFAVAANNSSHAPGLLAEAQMQAPHLAAKAETRAPGLAAEAAMQAPDLAAEAETQAPGLAAEAVTQVPSPAAEAQSNVFAWRWPHRHYFDTHQLTEKPVPLHDLSAAHLAGLPVGGAHTAILTLLIAEDGRIDAVEPDSATLTASELRLLAKGFQDILFTPGRIGNIAVRTRMKIEVTIENRGYPIAPE